VGPGHYLSLAAGIFEEAIPYRAHPACAKVARIDAGPRSDPLRSCGSDVSPVYCTCDSINKDGKELIC
jgi:hypothetical protein